MFTCRIRSYLTIASGLVVWNGVKVIVFCRCCWRAHLLLKMMKGPPEFRKIINQLILNFRNRSKCSLVAFDHNICWSRMVLLSELERKLSYYAAKMDGYIFLQNDEMTSCSNIEYKSHNFQYQEPIKAFTGSVQLYVSNMAGLVVWSGAEVAVLCSSKSCSNIEYKSHNFQY